MLLAVIAGAIPLVVSRPAPFVDWPNHLARVFIFVRLVQGDRFWSGFYTLNTHPVPNEALDFGIGALHLAGLSIDAAAIVFLLATYAIFVAGVHRLAGALGAADPSKPVLAALLFTTGPLMYGLVNYVLGLGLAMWLIAAWLPAPQPRRWLIATVGTIALFYVHLLAAAVWVLVAGCVELPALFVLVRSRRMGLMRFASSIGACVVFLALLVTSSAGADALPKLDGSNIFYMGQGSLPDVLRWKIAVFVRIFSDHADLAVAVASWLLLLGLAIVLAMRARPRLRPPIAAAILILLAGVLIFPESAGIGSLLDYRLVLPMLLLAAAAHQPNWRSDAARRTAFVLLLGLVLIRATAFAAAFSQEAEVYRAFDAVVRTLPPGSIMLTARGRTDEDIPVPTWWGPPMEHVATRAVLHGILVPTVFAVESQQPIVLNHALDPWRNEWRVANPAEFAAMVNEIRPLCRIASAQGRDVYLFEAYPGETTQLADPSSWMVATPAFKIFDACALREPAGVSADTQAHAEK